MEKAKSIRSMEIVDRNSGSEFYVKIHRGDVFISFHPTKGNAFATMIKKYDCTKENYRQLLDECIKAYKIEPNDTEVKLIGMRETLRGVSQVLELKKFTQRKMVEKEDETEVIFLAEENKVRVAKSLENEETEKRKFKVLIVDDSKTIRNILTKVFSSDSELEVCATAERPSEVEDLIKKHKPDVITLDIHMPEMDGVTLLKKIAPLYHIPTVMITSISIAEGPLVLEALENGAVDYIQKPEVSHLDRLTPMMIEKVKTAAKAKVQKKASGGRSHIAPTRLNNEFNLDTLILMGSSTGGTEALREILTKLPKNVPPILIVQHIPAVFSLAFAKRMNELCPFEVKEAEDGDEVKINRVLIAPGGMQMKLEHKGGKSVVRLTDDEPVNRFKPSVDYLFLSATSQLQNHTLAVILTGMGRDGARGMLELRNKGVRTIAQDEATCVVFGMPKEAINIGGAEFVSPLHDIAAKMVELSHDRSKNQKKIS